MGLAPTTNIFVALALGDERTRTHITVNSDLEMLNTIHSPATRVANLYFTLRYYTVQNIKN